MDFDASIHFPSPPNLGCARTLAKREALGLSPSLNPYHLQVSGVHLLLRLCGADGGGQRGVDAQLAAAQAGQRHALPAGGFLERLSGAKRTPSQSPWIPWESQHEHVQKPKPVR